MNCPLCNSNNTKLEWAYHKSNIHRYYATDPLYEGNPVDVTKEIDKNINLFECKDCDLRFYDPPITGGYGFYGQLQQFWWYYKKEKPEFDYAKSYINTNDRVLEIGCGEGYFGELIKECDYTGLDPYSQNSKVIKQNIHEHQGIYDVVCGFQVLEHVTDTGEFIKSALRCLKTNGLLILSVPNEDSFLGKIEGWSLNYPPHHVTRFTEQCLKNIANLFNLTFEDLKREPMSDYHRDDLLGEKKYSILDNNINLTIGHTVLVVYRKN